MLTIGDMKRIFVPQKLKNEDLVEFSRENFASTHVTRHGCRPDSDLCPCGELAQYCTPSEVHFAKQDMDLVTTLKFLSPLKIPVSPSLCL